MGKKKKFIDKKNAQHFNLVHRSQRDPLTADENSSQHVLVPADAASSSSNQNHSNSTKEEKAKFGIYFDDDYDYMQHLRDRGSGVLVLSEPSETTQGNEGKKFGTISLPSEVLPSEYEEDVGMLNLGVLPRGPQPDWDPDIVEALDDGIDFDDPENFLEDDFIKIANSELDKSNFIAQDFSKRNFDDSDGDVGSDIDSDELLSDNMSYESDGDDVKSRFTNYSMTSSVIRRNEGLKTLDDRFEKILEEYGEDELGAVDHEELTGFFNAKSELVENIINDHIETHKLGDLPEKEDDYKHEMIKSDGEEESTDDEKLFSQFEKKPKNEWDCESYISTYSNLYNHPKLLDVKTGDTKKIIINEKTGLPNDVFQKKIKDNEDDMIEDLPEKINNIRLKNETPEEKKRRKQEVKKQRKDRRVEKKNNKIAFKNEIQKQQISSINMACQKGIKI